MCKIVRIVQVKMVGERGVAGLVFASVEVVH